MKLKRLERELYHTVQIRKYRRPSKVDLVELGKDIYVRNLTYKQIAEKHGVSIDRIQEFTKKVKPPQYVHVRLANRKWKWIHRDNMKIRLELELENKSWSASEIMGGLGRLINNLESGVNSTGPILDKKDRVVGRWEIETFKPVKASKKVTI